MIDIDEYIGMWDDNLLGSEGVNDLMSALIAEVERLRELYTHYYLVANHYEGDRCLENCPICYGDEEE